VRWRTSTGFADPQWMKLRVGHPRLYTIHENGLIMRASLQWVALGLWTEDRCHLGRDNHSYIFSASSRHVVGWHLVLSAACWDAGGYGATGMLMKLAAPAVCQMRCVVFR
jgi:hypothetical protein